MKYSNSNKPMVCMQTTSACYKGTGPMTVKGVLWHSTGANNPNLKRYVQPSDNASDRDEMLEILGVNTLKNDWNHTNRQAGMNCWIGKLANGEVTTVQTMPWNYRPWGCGGGSKGSCNNGWIQFEICEDSLTDRSYFDKVYEEACEITAYLCEMFNINPKGTVMYNGVAVPTILCHGDSNKLGFGSAHVDVNHWFPKYGKSMETVRDDVAKLMGKTSSTAPEVETPKADVAYYVRTSWDNISSQKGAFTNLDNAKKCCDTAGNDYFVFNKNGEAIYPDGDEGTLKVGDEGTLKVGDEVVLRTGTKYSNGKAIPSWVFKSKLYLREIRDNSTMVISTVKSGPITGVVPSSAVVAYAAGGVAADPAFQSYIVRITGDTVNIRAGANIAYKINGIVRKNQLYTIVAEKNGWGQLKSGVGWINLAYTKRLK